MKILMIGGTGNISAPVTAALVARGEDVVIYNRGSQAVAGTRQVTGDRNDGPAFERQMADLLGREGNFDCVIDMIAYHPDHGRSLVRALGGKMTQYIFCSTVDVYTKTRSGYPLREDFERNPNPAFEYAAHKAILEKEFEAASQQGAFALTILRPAATYNDTSTPIALLGSGLGLLQRMRKGQPVIVLGDGNGIWCAAHRDDVAAAFVEAVGLERAYGKAYHLTGEEWMTWKTYYSTAAQAMQASAIDFVGIPAELLARITRGAANWSAWNFQYNNIFDNRQARDDLGFRYQIPWAEGVARQIAYHDARGSIDSAAPDPLVDEVVSAWRKHADRLASELDA